MSILMSQPTFWFGLSTIFGGFFLAGVFGLLIWTRS